MSLDLKIVRDIEPRLDCIEESSIIDPYGSHLGWTSSAVTSARVALGTGCHEDRNIARRIALAETLERACVLAVRQSSGCTNLLLDEYPTTCGFAAGFDDSKTAMRSLCEGLERWVWSKWIDEKCCLSKISVNADSLSKLTHYFLTAFSEVDFYSEEFDVSVAGRAPVRLRFGAILAQDGDGGVYPGSRVCSLAEDPWEHAAIEVWRHKALAVQMGSEPSELFNARPVFQKRVLFFSQNGVVARRQIVAADRSNWVTPIVRLHKRVQLQFAGFYLWRTLFFDFQGWDKGPLDRFVY